LLLKRDANGTQFADEHIRHLVINASAGAIVASEDAKQPPPAVLNVIGVVRVIERIQTAVAQAVGGPARDVSGLVAVASQQVDAVIMKVLRFHDAPPL